MLSGKLLLDNATPHRSAVVQQQLLDNSVAEIFFQTPSSPNLNPIENVWVILKRELAKHNCQTAQQLHEALEAKWQMLMPDDIRPFAESMHRRLEAVIDADGGQTKILIIYLSSQ